jgi:diacylglycerol kinase (ATP)
MKKTVTLIIHGHRKISEKSAETIALLENESMLIVKKKITKGPGDATEIAHHANSTSDIIIAVGGDGTCNEVINGLMIKPNSKIIFGVIPNGTGNDFVRNFPPFDPYTFVTAIVDASIQSIDLGKLTFGKATRYFLNVADIGFGAKVIDTMNKQRRAGIGGRMSYNLAIIRTFFTFRKPIMKVKGDGFEFEGKSLMIIFSNGTTFGHGLQIHPEAKLDSGKLGLAVIGKVSLIEYARNLKNLTEGRKIIHPEVHYHDFEKIDVSCSDKNMMVETDGEIAGRSTITVEVIPRTLHIVSY